jgi:hypothetical protein
MKWYYVNAAEQQAGPVDDAGLEALGASGQITPETLIWREGMTDWLPCGEVRPVAVPVSTAPTTEGEEAVCEECRELFPMVDTSRIDGRRICKNCNPANRKKQKSGDPEKPGDSPSTGALSRFRAFLTKRH